MRDHSWCSSNAIRNRFSQAMSAMYQAEVPQYATLLELVAQVNSEVLAADPVLAARLSDAGDNQRLAVERHGAIRVGTPDELAMLCRLFAVMGMVPVGYYDLSQAGVPVHSTAFRPVTAAALRANPFRVFTSLVRFDLIEDRGLRRRAEAIVDRRDIFTRGVRALIARHEQQGGLRPDDAERFVAEALETFRWHHEATVDLATYQALHAAHRLIADVVCFRGPHINHLTPRTLDIDAVHARMAGRGMTPKRLIEGPPRRDCPILLRQTSFQALAESIRFAGDDEAHHTARFGEIEQRGAALKPAGRALYDQLLNQARARAAAGDNTAYQQTLAGLFADFPDTEAELRRQSLAFFEYYLTPRGRRQGLAGHADMEREIADRRVAARPITYEDFLPVSAAGIFQSNLVDRSGEGYAGAGRRDVFEAALGRPVIDDTALYAQIERASRTALQAVAGEGREPVERGGNVL